jgi:hypothetical protein
MGSLHDDEGIAFLFVYLDELLVLGIVPLGLELVPLALVSALLALAVGTLLAGCRIVAEELFAEVFGGVNSAFGGGSLGRTGCQGNGIVVFEVALDILLTGFGIVGSVGIVILLVGVVVVPALDIEQGLFLLLVFEGGHFC